MGLAAARAFRGGLRRLLEAQLLVDESWAISQADAGASARTGAGPRFDRRRLVGAGLLLYVAWVGGTALGAAVGDGLDPAEFGLDAACPALFLALMTPLVRTRNALAAAVAGAGLALVLTPITPAGVPVIAAMLGALAGLLPDRALRGEARARPGVAEEAS